jgi:hypothetical protein
MTPHQRDAYTQAETDEPLPVLTDAEIDDGYRATKPGIIGAARTALVLHADDDGVVFGSLVVKDGTPDVHRNAQIALYSRLKRERRAARTTPDPGIPK